MLRTQPETNLRNGQTKTAKIFKRWGAKIWSHTTLQIVCATLVLVVVGMLVLGFLFLLVYYLWKEIFKILKGEESSSDTD